MHYLAYLASFLGLGGVEMSVIIVVFSLIFGAIMGIAGMIFAHQKQKLWHETTRLALEKGQPVPVDTSEMEPSRPSTGQPEQHDLRGGLVLIAVGVGSYIFLSAIATHQVALLAYIPGLIGVALIVHWLLMNLLSRNSTPRNPRA